MPSTFTLRRRHEVLRSFKKKAAWVNLNGTTKDLSTCVCASARECPVSRLSPFGSGQQSASRCRRDAGSDFPAKGERQSFQSKAGRANHDLPHCVFAPSKRCVQQPSTFGVLSAPQNVPLDKAEVSSVSQGVEVGKVGAFLQGTNVAKVQSFS